MANTGTITSHESGVDLLVEWQIPRFSTLPETDGAWYRSPLFSFGGEGWYLDIHPNGRSTRGTSGYVDLSLNKWYSGRSINVSFSLSLKTAKGERCKEEHYTKDFDDVDKWSHLFNRFMPRAELTTLRSDLLPDDVLTIVCTMKGSTSAGRDSTPKRYRPFSQWNRKEKVTPTKAALAGNPASADISTPVSDSAGCSSDSGECRHCKGNFATGILSSHQRKCEQRPVKCPDCQEVVMLQKFLNEHECRHERPEGEACASGTSTCSFDHELHRDFKQLYLNKEDCDVILKVKGSEFPAHRLILKARSPVFASTFRHNMKENATGIVEIEDCEPFSFSDFLRYLYCGDANLISQENVFDLFTAADKYHVSNLRAKCLEFMKQNLSVDTFCESLTLALRHSEAELIRLCTDYFKQNVPRIIVTVKWQTFLAENPTESNELLVKYFLPNDS